MRKLNHILGADTGLLKSLPIQTNVLVPFKRYGRPKQRSFSNNFSRSILCKSKWNSLLCRILLKKSFQEIQYQWNSFKASNIDVFELIRTALPSYAGLRYTVEATIIENGTSKNVWLGYWKWTWIPDFF